MTELALAAYRPREGHEDELLRVLEQDIATLRRRGHVTDRRAPLVRTESGELLVVLEWSSEHAVDDAHEDLEVLSVWKRKDQLAHYVSPSELAGAEMPFARWSVVDDF